MKIVLDHDHCKHANAYSDRCLSTTLRFPLGHERFCMTECTDDGQPEVTVVLREGGQEYTRVFESEEELSQAAFDGSFAAV